MKNKKLKVKTTTVKNKKELLKILIKTKEEQIIIKSKVISLFFSKNK